MKKPQNESRIVHQLVAIKFRLAIPRALHQSAEGRAPTKARRHLEPKGRTIIVFGCYYIMQMIKRRTAGQKAQYFQGKLPKGDFLLHTLSSLSKTEDKNLTGEIWL